MKKLSLMLCAAATLVAFVSFAGAIRVSVPVPGVVLKIFVRQGEYVRAGQKLMHVDFMKMQFMIQAPRSGTVTKINVAETEVFHLFECARCTGHYRQHLGA